MTEEIERLHFLGAIVEATPTALFVKDGASGRYLLANRAAEDMLGFSREEMIGRVDHELFPEAQADFFTGIDRQVIAAGGVTLIEEEEVTSGHGQHRWSRTRKSAVDGLGGAKYLIAVAEDITEAKDAKAALHLALTAAEDANRAQSDFLTNMSHEIRTPLNGVLGMVQVMLADTVTDRQKEHLRTIRRSGETLLSVLNDLLDISRIETGSIETEITDFDLAEAVRSAVAPFLPAAQTKGLTVTVKSSEAVKGLCRGDGARFGRVMHNLVSNAIKFTDQGSIDIALDRDSAGLRVTVSDTGIGISAEDLPRVFDAFVQGDSSLTRRYGGSGLGLSICRALVDQMEGTIDVESVPGRGATVSLLLPFPVAPPESPPCEEASPDDDTPAPRVLVAEDNPVNQQVIKALLLHAGIDPMVVDNGRLAVAAWEAASWDLILMDIQMPEMDGVTATRAIRAGEAASRRERTPIIAVTANVMVHQTEAYRTAGMDAVLAKPVNAAKLFAAMNAAFAGDPDPSASGPADGTPTARCA